MQRLGLNKDRYLGECIDIEGLLREITELASLNGWTSDPIILPSGQTRLGFLKLSSRPRRHIYISSGMHGDEPAGPLAVRSLLKLNAWPDDISFYLLPCLNPEGFKRNTRENEDGIDLNRDYRDPKSPLVKAHIQWLERRPRFDLSLCLHEDWESHGFYLYELNPDLQKSCAEAVIEAVRPVCPIDVSPVIEGRQASGGIICANPDLLKRPDWPEAFYLIHNKTRLSFTFEGPSDFPLQTRVDSLVAAVSAVLKAV